MKKIFAVIFTLISIFAIRECYIVFTSLQPDVAAQRNQLILVNLSIIVPLLLFTLWLWLSGKKKTNKN